MAARYLGAHKAKYEGLILLASYTTTDLSHTSLRAISIYGSKDGVLNRESYQENKKNLPEHTTEVVLPSGIHSYFGDYGIQKKDGRPTISNHKQINAATKVIVATLKRTGSI